MLKLVLAIPILCVGGVHGQGWCQDSYSGCAFGSCCVDSNNKILSLQMGAFGPQTHTVLYGGGAINGTCVQRKAQKGEMCDAKCQCATGKKLKMEKCLVYAAAVILFVSVKACTESFSCGAGHCCVDSNQQTISSQQIGGFWPSRQKNGTCVQMRAQKGQLCDNTCQCGAGLKCYHTLGSTWHPSLCYDATFVNRQQQYWSDCNSGKIHGCTVPP